MTMDRGPGGSRLVLRSGDMARLVGELDWAATPIGPIGGWPAGLTSSVNLCLASPLPALVAWGDELTQVYNDAASQVLGERHPAALGQRARASWGELWATLAPALRRALETGEATRSPVLRLPVRRDDAVEEAFYELCVSPVFDDVGAVGGLFGQFVDTTEQVVSARRWRLLGELGQCPPPASVADACRLVADVVAGGDDIRFALVYLGGGGSFRLAAAAGLEGPLAAADVWPLAAAVDARQAVVSRDLGVHHGAIGVGLWGRAVDAAVVVPGGRLGGEHGAAVLVLGATPLRPLDPAFHGYLVLAANAALGVIARAQAADDERALGLSAERAILAREECLAVVGQDLRAPLAAIDAAGQLLDRWLVRDTSADAARLRKQVATIGRSAQRMHRHIGELLDIASIDAGALFLERHDHTPDELLRETQASFEGPARERGVDLVVDLDPSLEPIDCDKERLLQVIGALVSHAIDTTPAGGRVGVHAKRDAQGLVVSVRDNGKGITADVAEHLFDRQWDAVARARKGHSLELPIAQGIVHAHGGEIAAESVAGGGTTLWFTVPSSDAASMLERKTSAATLAAIADGTTRVEALRRLATLREIARIAEGRSAEQALRRVVDVLGRNPTDVPFALVYLWRESDTEARLVAASGLKPGHRAAPARAAVGASGDGWPLAAAASEGSTVVMSDLGVIFGSVSSGVPAEAPRSAVLVPLAQPTVADQHGVIVLGVNPLRPLDDAYRSFFELVGEHVAGALASARALADERRRAEDAFLAIAAHELRTPLTSLALQLEGLAGALGREDPPSQRSMGNKMRVALRATERLGDLIEALLDVSRASVGRLELERVERDLASLVGGVVDRCFDDAQATGSTIDASLDPAPGAWDVRRLEQAVTSALSTALRSAPGTRIEVRLGTKAGEAVLSIRHAGLGYSTEEVGLGVGLYLTRHIVEAHGGKIEVQSSPDAGAHLTMRLPLALA